MAMTKLSRNTQMVVMIAGGILILHFYNLFFYKPLRKEVRFLSQERTRISNELGTINADKDELAKAEEVYKGHFQEFSQFEAKVLDLETKLPSRKNMAEPLEQLTSTLEELGGEFIVLEPTFKKAEEAEFFDSIEIKMQFYADYPLVIDYLKKLEEQSIVFSIKKIEMTLDEEVSKTPLVSILFSTFLSDRPGKVAKKESTSQEGTISIQTESPFKSESKPYDNTLPGDHRLTMVIWKGGRPTALIDGKLTAEGSIIDNKTLTKIESDGVWFTEEGIRYYLALEKRA
jgi:hypothetical protein